MSETNITGDDRDQAAVPGSAVQPPAGPQAAAPAPLDAGTAFSPEEAEQSGPSAADAAPSEFMPQPGEAPEPDKLAHDEVITWSASEFVAHHKSAGWYGILALVALALAIIVYFVTKDPISTGAVIVGAILFGIVAARQPRELQYQLDGKGVQVGAKYQNYTAFRSFSVVPEGAFSSIIFMPLRRFAPLTTIYYAPEDERRIVDLLTDNLPLEEYKHDAFDQLMRRIRF